jgi:hypothetical protein
MRTNPANIASLGDELPFYGPGRTKYEAVKSGRVSRTDGWWYLTAEAVPFADSVE